MKNLSPFPTIPFNARSLRLLLVCSALCLGLAACQAQNSSSLAEDTPTPTRPAATPPAAAFTPVAGATPSQSAPATYTLPGATTTADGLQFLELRAGTGPAPELGDLVTMSYTATLPDGTEVLSSKIGTMPHSVVYGRNQLLAGWEEGLGLMRAGGKARLLLPPNLAFGDNPPTNVPANTPIILELDLLKVQPIPTPEKVASELYKKNPSGLQFYDLKVGTGKVALSKTFAKTSFTLWVKGATTNTYVASSEGQNLVFFMAGKSGAVITGWSEGVIGMKVGGIRQLVIPPSLGYGDKGTSDIPANATLIMEIELVDVHDPIKQTTVNDADLKTTASGLKYYDIQEGVGSSPQNGQTVVVNYTGWLADGTQFDSSFDRGQPIVFKLGAGQVIKGWEEGLLSMKPGGRRKLIVPPALGYGDNGVGNVIPGGATLTFEVELLEIRP